eukprot:TRINITY_DN26116_c0_g3_i1.p2 TRINITY_DN26116_c0_g3~~TRINITY_DN26116_c0_g3_i1.p2  ORF type:complete len:342 (-),score=69.24 TRINITY_DN26116_c0_g3_i1:278-1303(-)
MSRRPQSARCSARYPRVPPEDCPGWWLHWSKPDCKGRSPCFCSCCGSRAASRRRLNDASAMAQHQVDLLREIARRQEQDISQLKAERDFLNQDLVRRSTAAAAAAAAAAAEPVSARPKADHEMELQHLTAIVERLRRETQVWRTEACGISEAFPAAAESAPSAMSQRSVQHEAERQRRAAHRASLERELEELHLRCSTAAAETAAQRDSGLSASLRRLASARGDAARLYEELIPERNAASLAWEKTAEVRRQIEEQRSAQAAAQAQSERESNALADERMQAERRLDAEKELDRAQQAQLRSILEATEAVRNQLQLARRENTELRASMQQGQSTFERLRQRA